VGSRLNGRSRDYHIRRAVSVGGRWSTRGGVRLVGRSAGAQDRRHAKHKRQEFGRAAHQSRRERGASRGTGSVTGVRTRQRDAAGKISRLSRASTQSRLHTLRRCQKPKEIWQASAEDRAPFMVHDTTRAEQLFRREQKDVIGGTLGLLTDRYIGNM
jgi:hypothetical protein